jgi:hypothetical protein
VSITEHPSNAVVGEVLQVYTCARRSAAHTLAAALLHAVPAAAADFSAARLVATQMRCRPLAAIQESQTYKKRRRMKKLVISEQ